MIRVGVIRGGVSPEYDISLASGGRVLSSLDKDKYKPIDILITKDGEWHMNGLPVNAEKLKMSVDIIWNALHGHFGEDGKLQKFLDNLDIPYVGSGPVPSSVTHNKMMTREKLESMGYKVPKSRVLKHVTPEMVELIAQDIFRTIVPPWVVKPLSGGSSIHTYAPRTFDELVYSIETASANASEILVEEYIFGKELFAGVIDGFRGEEKYVFPLFCITTDDAMFCTHHRTGGTYSFDIPKEIPQASRKEIEGHARAIHDALGLSGYSSIDFIHTPRGLYVLEVDSNPAIHEHAPFSRALDESGAPFDVFLDEVIRRKMNNT